MLSFLAIISDRPQTIWYYWIKSHIISFLQRYNKEIENTTVKL